MDKHKHASEPTALRQISDLAKQADEAVTRAAAERSLYVAMANVKDAIAAILAHEVTLINPERAADSLRALVIYFQNVMEETGQKVGYKL